ncbi:MAG: restriction endonuclease subunit S [Richelia sp. SL_2_1]|nr:restriction endonuclease subunit S [Richelia sp. SL_2_1]
MSSSRHQEYLDDLPVDWEKVPIDSLGTIYSGGTPRRDQPSFWSGKIAWVTPGELTSLNNKYLTKTREFISELGLTSSSAQMLPSGSLLVTTRATIGLVVISKIPVCTNQGFKNIVPNKLTNSNFYYYLLKYIVSEMSRLAMGSTFDEISRRDFSTIIVPRPEFQEQQKIAEILDTVDKAIALTQTHISKLKLAKAGLLHDLLTKGIDEHGELRNPTRNPQQFKDSSLGRIPKDWDVVNLESLCERITDGSHQSVTTSDTGIPFLYVSCVRDGQILWEQAAKISDLLYTQISKGREPKSWLNIIYCGWFLRSCCSS